MNCDRQEFQYSSSWSNLIQFNTGYKHLSIYHKEGIILHCKYINSTSVYVDIETEGYLDN